MTINREAAEQMAARLTSTITSAVDVAETFNEALRLATVALQEPREVPEIKPGTIGTAATTCTCKTSTSACRAGCTHERVIDRTCPVHGEKAEAEAEAPVAPPHERIAEALKTAYTQIHNQDPRRKYAVSEVKQIVYPLISLLEESGFHEVESADEQAANMSQSQHDPSACGNPGCDC